MSVTLKPHLETEFFINKRGYFVIRQPQLMVDDGIIELTPDQMKATIKVMQSYLKESGSWWCSEISDGEL